MKNNVVYATSHFGSNININKVSSELDLSQVKSKCIFILSDLDDWLEDGRLSCDIIPISLSKHVGIDNFVLNMMDSNQNKEVVTVDSMWDNKFVKHLSRLLRNTVNTANKNKHHGSTGNYLGFGWTAKYDTNRKGGASYGRMAVKKGIGNGELEECIDVLVKDLQYVTDELDSILPGIIDGGQTITQALVDLSEYLYHDMQVNIMEALRKGMVSGFVCKNPKHFKFICRRIAHIHSLQYPLESQV